MKVESIESRVLRVIGKDLILVSLSVYPSGKR
jgi:hypothetical protein